MLCGQRMAVNAGFDPTLTSSLASSLASSLVSSHTSSVGEGMRLAISETNMNGQDRRGISKLPKQTRNNRYAVPPLKLSLVSDNCRTEGTRKGFSSSRVARNLSETASLSKKWAACASFRAPQQSRLDAIGNTHLNADISNWNRSGSAQKATGSRSTEKDSYKYDTTRAAAGRQSQVSTKISSSHVDRGSGGDDSIQNSSSRYSSFPLRRSLLLKDVKHLKSFDTIAMIGQGGYAIVRVVKHKDTGMVCALKQIAKADFTNVAQLRMAFTEVDILSARESYSSNLLRKTSMAEASLSKKLKKKVIEATNPTEREALIRKLVQNRGAEYFPEFYGCWQTQEFVFFLMEYLPGGDLMKHLIDREVFPEIVAKFYTAQVAIAIGFLHDHLHYVHRDMKPDNVLFDRYGHTKLVDFGLSRQLPLCRDRRLPFTESFQSAVGTPDYMAPEVHRPGHPHDRTIDWWSLGIILYEMLFGGPPLSDLQHRPGVTSQIIRNWKSFLGPWPKHPNVSSNAKDLLNKLIAEKEERYKTVEEVLSHPWYHDIDLETLRDQEAMILPELTHDADVRNFDSFSMSKLAEWEDAKKKSTPSREVLNAFKTIASGPKSSTTHIPFASTDEPQRPTTTSGNTSSSNALAQSNGSSTLRQDSAGTSLKHEFKRSVTQHSQLMNDNQQHNRRNYLVPPSTAQSLTSRETVPKQTKLSSLNQLDRIPEGGAISAKEARINGLAKGQSTATDKHTDLGAVNHNNSGNTSSLGRTLPRGTSPPMMNKLSNSIGSEEKENRFRQVDRFCSHACTEGDSRESGSTLRLVRHQQQQQQQPQPQYTKPTTRRVSQRMKYADKRTQTIDSPRPNSDHEQVVLGVEAGEGGMMPSSSSSILSGLKNVVTRWLTSSTSSSHSSITGSNNNGESSSQPCSHLRGQHYRQDNKVTDCGHNSVIDNNHSKNITKAAAAVTATTCQTQPIRVGNLSARGGFEGDHHHNKNNSHHHLDRNKNFLPQLQHSDPSRQLSYTGNRVEPSKCGSVADNSEAIKQQLVRFHDGRGWQLLSVTGSQCCAVDRRRLSSTARGGNVACSLLNN